ncbi:MAG TPA: patatin-like phospholipase family protein [Anaeromyxobacter sp.]|nr:patatin-like phospholipase family protein [Anaeromyxobacter sp.]
MISLKNAAVAAALLAAGVARAAQPPASITISGGVSLGAYEAGLVYYTVEAMRLNPAAATPRIVTGASAGSVNGFMTILQSCGAAVADPTASLLWTAWIPLGLETLHVKGQAQKTSAFSRAAFDAPLDAIVRAWNAGLPESCDAVFGLSVTRLVPRVVTTEGEKLRLPRVEEHFQVRVQGRGLGRSPRLTNYVDPSWQGEQALLPEKDGEVVFAGLVDALFASTAFPGAFPPQAVQHCVVRGGKDARCPAEAARADLFVDGGVFDNTPVRLATRLAAAGLRVDAAGAARWLDAPDLSKRDLPRSLVLAYVSTDAQTFPEPTQETKPAKLESLLAVTAQVGGSFLTTARAKNLLYVHDDAPDVFEQLLVPERHLPAASAPLGAFFGFVEGELRRFDFALGMYDGRRLTEARIAARLGKAGVSGAPRFPEDAPGARQAAAGWRRYRCLQAVMDGAPAASETCAGDDLRDFRIVLQTSVERLWDVCARLAEGNETYDADPRCRRARLGQPVMTVPFVPPLAGDAWRRGVEENDASHAMRLLAAHGFEFKDLGLARDEAAKAPAALRARFLEIGDDVARTQPAGEGLVVSTLVKVGADAIAYVPPRFTVWAMYGRDPEIGISKGFEVGGVFVSPVRLHAAFQFVGSDQLLSSEHGHYAGAAVAGAEYLPSWWSNTRLQPSLLLRGGWVFSSKDDGGLGTCPDPGNDGIGYCSRATIQAGVSATLLERIRLQVTGNWYPPRRGGDEHQWAIGPGVGVQWGF